MVLALLLAGLGGTWFLCRPAPEEAWRAEEIRLASVFTGDTAAYEGLRAERDHAVPKIEDFLRRHHRMALTNLASDLGALGSPDPLIRKLAEARLTLAPEHCDAWLKVRGEEWPDSETKARLKSLLAGRSKARKQVMGFLSGLYAEHFNRLYTERSPALARDGHDFEAQLFFAYAPFEETWKRLRNAPADQQLRFLLLRLYAGRDRAAVEWLRRFSGTEVLEMASRTWWPVEIETSTTNAAAGHEIRAARLAGNTASQVLRVNLRPASGAATTREWSSIERWPRWLYVFRFKDSWNGQEGVAYQEGRVAWANRASGDLWGLPKDPEDDDLWLPACELCPIAWPGKCEPVRAVPRAVPVPVAVLTRQEIKDWSDGRVFAWSSSLFPPSVRERLHFEPNRHPVPTIYASMEEAKRPAPRRVNRRQ